MSFTHSLCLTHLAFILQNVYAGYGPFYPKLLSLSTAHFRNIFSAKFVPDGQDNKIVSCGMDGNIVLTDAIKVRIVS